MNMVLEHETPVGAWFAGGERIAYDPEKAQIDEHASLRVFVRHEGDLSHASTYMPGFPDGSIGWGRVQPHLPDSRTNQKLFVEYLGMGNSDKPKDVHYSTSERADLVEALWRHYGVKSTTLIAFDFSSLVVLEILRRRLERTARGELNDGPSIRGVFIFNGGLFTDGHSHPWYTTPILRLPGGGIAPWLGKRSFFMFKQLANAMWSREYNVPDHEVWELFEAMNHHDGLFFLNKGANFVAEHQAEGDRLDFAAIYAAYRNRFPFVVGGSTEDPFEKHQVTLAERRLGSQGLRIVRLPGGHLTTNEHPALLADLVSTFEAGLQAGDGN